MSNKQSQNRSWLESWHEIVFSINVAFASMTLLLASSERTLGFFSRTEVLINLHLGLRQTDFVRGYFTILVPSVISGFCLWSLLYRFSANGVVRVVLRFGAGMVALFTFPSFSWYQIKKLGFPYRGAPLELVCIFILAVLLLRRRWRLPILPTLLLIACHYAFFWFFIGGNYEMPNYVGPIGPILSFCSAVLWVLYLKRAEPKEPTSYVPDVRLVRV